LAKRIGILVEDLYQELEVWYPYLRLKEEGFEVRAIGTGKRDYRSKCGYPIREDASVDQVRAEDFDCVVIPGGYAPDHLRRHKKVNQFVRNVFNRGGVVASICHGGWVLVSAGILTGKRVTCFFAIKDDIINAGAEYEDSEVVVDGRLVTSRKPEDLPAFLKAIIGLLR
jgi:protease I